MQSANLRTKLVTAKIISYICGTNFNMFLNRITLRDYKNIASADLTFSPKINCISGKNGAGKTNLLDAVYYLSMTKSFFSSSDQYVYGYDAPEATLCGTYRTDSGAEERVSAAIRRGGEKIFRRGARTYDRFSDHVGLFPVVMVSPLDSALVNESGEERRKYLNFILSQTDREYLRNIQAYNKLLQLRNKLLKESVLQRDLLDTVSERMTPYAGYIFTARKELCERLQPMVRDFYSALSHGSEKASLEYRSDLYAGPLDRLLAGEGLREQALRYTTAGVQRDEVVFNLGEHPLRRCGSQGQQKSYLLAMKLAQFKFIKEIYGQTPILLLDDVFDKLDMTRVEDLLQIVSSLDFGQIFITDCNKVRLEELSSRIGTECRSFTVEGGAFSTAEI